VIALIGVVYCVPAVVFNVNQFPPLVVDAATVKTAELCPAALRTEIYCEGTLAPTAAAVKVRLGDVDVPPLAVTVTLVPLLLVVPTTKVTPTV
jgi:hypothetical protein